MQTSVTNTIIAARVWASLQATLGEGTFGRALPEFAPTSEQIGSVSVIDPGDR